LDAGVGWEEYLWSTDETTQTIEVEDGTFSVTVTHSTGCEYDDEVTVSTLNCIDPCDTIDFDGIEVTELNMSSCYAILDAGDGWAEYLWSTDETTQSITVYVANTYSVTVTHSPSGCEYSDDVTVEIPICDNVEEVDPSKVSTLIYPNPSKGEFVVELKNFKPGEYLIEIISITGKSLIKNAIQSTSESHKLQFNLSGYPKGLYMVKLEGNDYSHYERIMLE
jgi:hypothetical protein